MQLIRLKLRESCPFWFLGPINLTPDNPLSDIIDLDDIPEGYKQVIEKALKSGEDVRVDKSDLSDGYAVVIQGEDLVSIEDEEKIPDIPSVTVDGSETESTPQEDFTYTEEDISNAKIFLKRNTRTIIAALGKMDSTRENISLLLACAEAEMQGKSRPVIIEAIKSTTNDLVGRYKV